MAFTPKDWKDSPDATTPITAAALEDLETRVTDYTDDLLPDVVTSLPGSPADGDEVYYKVGTGDTALFWHLRYDSSITDSYKWRVVGAVDLHSEVNTAETTTSTSYTNLATTGPAVSAPLAGVYRLAFGAAMRNATIDIGTYMSFARGGSAATDSDRIEFDAQRANMFVSQVRQLELTLASAMALTAKYRVASANTGTWMTRWMRLTPVRVG